VSAIPLNFLVLVETAIKALKQATEIKSQTECKHFNPHFSCTVYPGINMHARTVVRVPSQFLVSGLFIAVPTNTEISHLFVYFVCNRLATHTQ